MIAFAGSKVIASLEDIGEPVQLESSLNRMVGRHHRPFKVMSGNEWRTSAGEKRQKSFSFSASCREASSRSSRLLSLLPRESRV